MFEDFQKLIFELYGFSLVDTSVFKGNRWSSHSEKKIENQYDTYQ